MLGYFVLFRYAHRAQNRTYLYSWDKS